MYIYIYIYMYIYTRMPIYIYIYIYIQREREREREGERDSYIYIYIYVCISQRKDPPSGEGFCSILCCVVVPKLNRLLNKSSEIQKAIDNHLTFVKHERLEPLGAQTLPHGGPRRFPSKSDTPILCKMGVHLGVFL